MSFDSSLPDASAHSVLRELIVEHHLIGEMLRLYWCQHVTDVEVLRSETDSFGYDLVFARGEIVRHVQLKTVNLGGKATETKVALSLQEKPSGCVLWIVLRPDLSWDHFLYFGGSPGKRIPDLGGFKVAKHTKADISGNKAERPRHRVVPRRMFTRFETLEAVAHQLLG